MTPDPETDADGGELPDLLLVEDELMIALEIQGLVEEAGLARVHIAGNDDAARQLTQDLPRLSGVVLDVNLGEGTTLSFAEELRARKIPFAFATGYEPGTGLLAEFPEVPIIPKPFDAADLLKTIGGLIGGPGRLRAKDTTSLNPVGE